MSIHLPSRRLWRGFRADWWTLLKQTWASAGEKNLTLLAAGAAFYTFSSIAPILAATVLVYGLIATPETVSQNIRGLFDVLPRDAASLISGQLDTVVNGSQGKKGLGLLIAVVIALYGGSKAASAMMTALNVAFGVKERRNFVIVTLVAIGIVAGGIVLLLAGIGSGTVLAILSNFITGAPAIVLTLLGLLSYVVLAAIAFTGAAALYRFGPSVPNARFRWGTPGTVLATLMWLGATLGFGIYVSNFGNYNATYGSLGAIIVSLTWLWLSAYAFVLGAELDSRIAATVYGARAADMPAAPAPARREPEAEASSPVKGTLLTAVGLGMLATGRTRDDAASAKVTRAPRAR